MRIGYVLKKYPRLSETFIVNEILGLESREVETAIYSLNPPNDARFQPSVGAVRGEVTYLPPFGSGAAAAAFDVLGDEDPRPRERFREAMELLRWLPGEKHAKIMVQALHMVAAARRDGLDHLHAHFMTVAAHVTCLAHVLSGIPFTVTAHAKDIFRSTVDRAVFDEVARRARAIITVSEYNRRFIEDHLLETGSPARIEVIYNGLPLDDVPVGNGARDPDLVLGVGRLVEKKGFDVMLHAIASLRAAGRNVRGMIVGTGEEREALERLASELGLGGAIEMPGAMQRDEVLALMRRARVLAAPCVTGRDGNRDALPTVLIEALASGLPVVTTSVGGIPEIVEDGVHGRVVPERDQDAFTAALSSTIDDDSLWSSMAAEGPARARERFDRERTIERFLDVVAGNPAPSR